MTMGAPRLLLVRHGRAADIEGRCIGHTDVPLSPTGATEVTALATSWHPGPSTRLITSDLQRARDTARLLAQQWDVAIHAVDPRWRELDFGAWDGERWDVLEATDGHALTHWMTDWAESAPPDGETAGALVTRVRAAAEAALAAAEADGVETLVVVTHAGAMRAALEALVGWPRALWFRCTLDYGHLIELRRAGPGEWSIIRLNSDVPSGPAVVRAPRAAVRTD